MLEARLPSEVFLRSPTAGGLQATECNARRAAPKKGRKRPYGQHLARRRHGGLTETIPHFSLNDSDDMSAKINRPDEDATGAGDLSITIAPAAVANTTLDATGARIRQVPREGCTGLEQLACSGEPGDKGCIT
jgi:hypothetical protein